MSKGGQCFNSRKQEYVVFECFPLCSHFPFVLISHFKLLLVRHIMSKHTIRFTLITIIYSLVCLTGRLQYLPFSLQTVCCICK